MTPLLETARQVFGKNFVNQPPLPGCNFLESHGRGSYLWDDQVNKYLDAYTSAGTYNLGRHPTPLVTALKSGIKETDQGNFVLISKEKTDLAKALAEFMPGSLDCSYFSVVRGEAMEAACKLARGKTQRPELICFKGGWHGDTGFGLSLGALKEKEMFGPLIPDITCLPFNQTQGLEQAITHRTAAVILEPIQVENGCIEAETDFMTKVRQACTQTGALMILDETQTGFGRTGNKFAFESYGIQPDILIFGEAVCAGMFNMSGISFTPDVKSFFDDHPLIHLCTFGGHDLGCRVAKKALILYESECPWKRAEKMEKNLAQALDELKKSSTQKIKKIRVSGGLGAIIFEDPCISQAFCERVKDAGAIVVKGRVDKASVLIRPSLTISPEELMVLADCLKKGARSL